MIGRLIDRWEYTWNDIWEPLGSHPQAKDDIYIELYRSTIDKFKKRLSYDEESMLSSDPEKAREALQAIKKVDLKGETSVIAIFEDIYDALEEYGSDSLENLYLRLVKTFLTRYNLRYRLKEPFHLMVQLPWVYADMYMELAKINNRDAHLSELMSDFENAFDNFMKTRRNRDLSISIHRASNYAEGIAAVSLKSGNSNSLGQMCDELSAIRVWPHEAIKKSLQELYKFCSDYPGVRHSGNRNSRLRNLEIKDTIIISTLLIAFSGYIHNQVNGSRLLDG